MSGTQTLFAALPWKSTYFVWGRKVPYWLWRIAPHSARAVEIAASDEFDEQAFFEAEMERRYGGPAE